MKIPFQQKQAILTSFCVLVVVIVGMGRMIIIKCRMVTNIKYDDELNIFQSQNCFCDDDNQIQ